MTLKGKAYIASPVMVVKEDSAMFLIKLIGKILLLPVVLLLAILRLLVKIGMEISSFILGALMRSSSAASSLPSCSTPGVPWRS